MRTPASRDKVFALFQAIGDGARGPGNVYLVGGATALLLGLRAQTVDIDLKLDPAPQGIFEILARLKERLTVSIELAAPDQFIPALPGWRERSEYIETVGQVTFYHYDFYGQALAKIERGLDQDMADACDLVAHGKVDPDRLVELFTQAVPDLVRYPAVNPGAFAAKVVQFTASVRRSA